MSQFVDECLPGALVVGQRVGRSADTGQGPHPQRDQAFATFHSTLLTALEDVENALVSLSQERIRAINAGSDSAFRVAVPNMTMRVIQTDGFPVVPANRFFDSIGKKSSDTSSLVAIIS